MKNIRNFVLIAHIDHGKSTLADRIMEICGAVGSSHPEQLLDNLELEREHGITIKLKAIRLSYALDAKHYTLNLIDTPGHVDFSYEVSRSLASVEGAVLLVDATKGVQAQTLANFNLALGANLTLIPVINKIDLPQADIAKTQEELAHLGFSPEEIIKVSAKTGQNIEHLLTEIIRRIPDPAVVLAKKGIATGGKLQALIFDSALDPYKGVVATIRVFSGQISVGDQVLFLATQTTAEILQIGHLSPKPVYGETIGEGEIGFMVTNIKDLSKVLVGDTVTSSDNLANPLPGYKEAKPVVFLSFYPINNSNFPKLKDGLEKLKLNDAALSFTQEFSPALGQGFRCGFLGLLHAQITQERLEREYGLEIIATSPSVNYLINGRKINKPGDFDPTAKDVKEPYAKVTIFVPNHHYGAISKLIFDKRGAITTHQTMGTLAKIEAQIPLFELLTGFYDQLKSLTSGFASFDFEISHYQETKLVKLDFLVNYEPIEGLAQIVPAEKAQTVSRKLVEKLKESIPRQQIPIPIQAAIGLPAEAYGSSRWQAGGKIIARETIPAYRKDVTVKLYGGDVTRKLKLLEKQKKGKKRMRKFGKVEIPQEAFLAIFKT